MSADETSEDFAAGHTVGYAEGYLEAHGAAPVFEVQLCTCELITGGNVVRKPTCPHHGDGRSDVV